MRYAAFFLCLLPSLVFAQDVVRIRAGVRDTVTVSAASTVLVTTESDPLFGAKFAQSIGVYDTRTVSATLYAPLAHASATNNPHGVTAAQVGAYTTGAVDALLAGKIDCVTVATYADAVTAATGSTRKLIEVAADTDGSPSLYLYRPASNFTDKLERILTY